MAALAQRRLYLTPDTSHLTPLSLTLSFVNEERGYLRATTDGVLLSVKLQPRASKNEIGDALGGELRIKVTAPPVDSAANEALIELLAETLGCAKNRVELLRGQTARHKLIKLHGFRVEEVSSKLQGPSRA